MERMSIPEAADTLGLTRDAIRKRVKRDSIEWETDASGETFVFVDASGPPEDASETGGDTSGRNGDKSADTSGQALVESLQEQIAYLRSEVGVWQEEARRKDHLLAAALERIPPQLEPSESPDKPAEEDSRGTGRVEDAEPQARSWWRRFFGL